MILFITANGTDLSAKIVASWLPDKGQRTGPDDVLFQFRKTRQLSGPSLIESPASMSATSATRFALYQHFLACSRKLRPFRAAWPRSSIPAA